MNHPAISVLMPVYNAERHLAQAIESVLQQTFTDFELIIINDGSTDSSKNIVTGFTDNRIRYFENEGNKGIVYTRNRLIKETKGKYIAWLDSDDTALPQRLKIQCHFLEQNPSYGLCGCYAKKIDENGKAIGRINLFSKDIDIKCNLLFTNSLVTSSVMARAELFKANLFNPEFIVTEDYDLWCRISKTTKLKNIPKYLIRYRWHQTNISKEKLDLITRMGQKVCAQELLYIDIVANSEELDLHSALLSKKFDTEPNNVSKFKPWLQKISSSNKQKGVYKNSDLTAMLYFRWIFALKERGNLKKLFTLRLKEFSLPAALKLLRLLIIRL